MGVLDDAIREHLELKRKHGASAEEVSREEQEALGAARREPAERPAAEPEPAVPAATAGSDAPVEPEAAAEPEAPVEPEPTPADAGPASPEPADVPSPAEDGGDDDVLEETPEFLQDTPEHDRLWFEQKPPRDFDFDDE
jgi:hypothetical protein